jgi:hypothetical protein
MNMSRLLGFQQQSYAVHQEVQVQQQSYTVEANAWHSKNQYDNQFSGMEVIMPAPCIIDSQLLKPHYKLSRKHGLPQNGWHGQDEHQSGWLETSTAQHYNNRVSGGKRLPLIIGVNSSQYFSNEMEENAEYETFHEARVPVRVQERRYYELRSWGDNGSPCRSYDEYVNLKHNGYGKSDQWVAVPRGP